MEVEEHLVERLLLSVWTQTCRCYNSAVFHRLCLLSSTPHEACVCMCVFWIVCRNQYRYKSNLLSCLSSEAVDDQCLSCVCMGVCSSCTVCVSVTCLTRLGFTYMTVCSFWESSCMCVNFVWGNLAKTAQQIVPVASNS